MNKPANMLCICIEKVNHLKILIHLKKIYESKKKSIQISKTILKKKEGRENEDIKRRENEEGELGIGLS